MAHASDRLPSSPVLSAHCRRSSRFCRSYANPRAPKSTATAIITITMGMVSLISRLDAKFTMHQCISPVVIF